MKKMKIGVLTFQTTNNFGAILQSYALQKVLQELGQNPEIINYQCEYISKPYKLINFKKKGIRGYLFSLIGYICYLPRTKACDNFRKHMKYSSKVNTKNINKIADDYDCYIVGSDQVWNYRLTNGDTRYLLDFVKENSKKFSYAASLGVKEIDLVHKETYSKLLSQFSFISVREKQGAEVVERLINQPVSVVLDPTLLLSANEWLQIAKDPKIEEEYILVYQLGISKRMVNFVKNISKKTGLRVLYIPFPLGGYVGCRCKWKIGPAEWLGLFANASYIVTDSFHGTAFSILFNKPFYTEASGQHQNVGSRLYNLLEMFGLEGCLFSDEIQFEIAPQVDYGSVNEKLEIERNKSKDFLKSFLDHSKSYGD